MNINLPIDMAHALEDVISSRRDTELTFDSSKLSGAKGLLKGQDGFSSDVFRRVYALPLKDGARAFIPWVKITFRYDLRKKKATISIPEDHLEQIYNREPAMQKAIEKYSEEKPKDILLNSERKDISFICPGCKKPIKHICGENK